MKIVTANRLSDGNPVYRTADGWADAIADAQTYDSDDAANEALAAAKKQETIVVGPYLMNVANPGEPVARERVRESIRARGPSTHPQFARPQNRQVPEA